MRILFVFFFFLLSQGSLAFLPDCDKKQLDIFRKQCVSSQLCSQGLKEDYKSCIQRRSHACFCLTYIGGRHYRQSSFEFTPFKIHGSFCGWRNATRKKDGSSLNWKNKVEALSYVKKARSQDALDEVCKIHDVDYLLPKADICKADKKAIQAFMDIHRSTQASELQREYALIMARSLEKNKRTCWIVSLFNNSFLWHWF